MTHAEYLDQHHELANAGLTVLATFLGRGDYAEAETALTNLRARLDALWAQRVADAQRTVNP